MDHSGYERILAVVDAALREAFPENYDARCMYASFGIRDLLREAGEPANILAGDFLCFTVGRDGKPLLEGFGNSHDGRPSHFWVESGGRLLDLGPCYLPRRSRLNAVPMPPVSWRLSSPLPLYLRYRRLQRWPQDVELHPDDPLGDRMNQFRQVLTRLATTRLTPPWSWMLHSPSAVTRASQAGDPWAYATLQFLKIADIRTLPF